MQTKIIKEMHVKEQINEAQEVQKRVALLTSTLKASGLKTYVLGISGGQDSTLCGKLIQLAVDELNASEDQTYTFIAVRLPYAIQFDEDDCQAALEFIKPSKTITYNIQQVVDGHINSFEQINIKISDFQKGNIKARERMIAQYAIAGTYQGLVVGTDHAAECITGFFTKHGDGACDIAPLFGLNKRQGKQILKYLNCPPNLYTKQPTADLEEDKPALADEVALGVSYEQIDDYLEGKEVDSQAKQIIENWYLKTNHKRAPITTLYNS